MIYTPENTSPEGARVYDMATREELKYVASIDTETGQVVAYEQPIRMVGEDIATVTRAFKRIDVSLDPLTQGLSAAHCFDEVLP